jgi:two-component system response regulator HydG
LEQQSWSGNLRELRNTVRRIVLFAEGEYITADDLPFSNQQPSPAPEADFEDDSERDQIVSMLKKARGNKTLAAQLLQIDRKTLYNKMHLYGIKL